MPAVYVSIGSNIEREQNIRSAIKALEKHFAPLVTSSVYETAAEGFDGDPFYNLVVGFDAEGVADIDRLLHAIEEQHGRVRGQAKFSSRTLDLDLLLYGDSVLPDYDIPRAEINRYAFVLWPLAEIAPNVIHPQLQQPIALLWQQFQAQHTITRDAIHAVEFSC